MGGLLGPQIKVESLFQKKGVSVTPSAADKWIVSDATMTWSLLICLEVYIFLFLLNSSLVLAPYLASELSHILCNMQMSPSLLSNHSEWNLIGMQQCFSAKGNH